MSEPSAHTTAHADDAVAPTPSDKPVLALPAPSDDDHVKLEVNGQTFSLYDKMGPTVVNSDGVSLPLPPSLGETLVRTRWLEHFRKNSMLRTDPVDLALDTVPNRRLG